MITIEKIELILENCESYTIATAHIGYFSLDEIETRVGRIACNAIAKTMTAKSVAMEILSAANITTYPFGLDEEGQTLFKRLSYHDITGIELTLSNGNVEQFYVDYDEGEHEGHLGAENVNEKTYISKPGNLYIVIHSKKKISDFFEKTLINDEDYAKVMSDMLTI